MKGNLHTGRSAAGRARDIGGEDIIKGINRLGSVVPVN